MLVIVDGTPQFNGDNDTATGINRGVLDNYDATELKALKYCWARTTVQFMAASHLAGAIIVTTKRAKRINNYYKEAPGVIIVKRQWLL